jgi:hypothetical protein
MLGLLTPTVQKHRKHYRDCSTAIENPKSKVFHSKGTSVIIIGIALSKALQANLTPIRDCGSESHGGGISKESCANICLRDASLVTGPPT